MKIVVIGGTGLIGSNVVSRLLGKGHDVVAASPKTGINTISGEGLEAALAGAQAVIDVSNAPDFSDQAVMDFFRTSTRNLLIAAARAGVSHYVALSVVGADRLPRSGYMLAKNAQESLIRAAAIPYTILRSTQFFEFAGGIANSAGDGKTLRLPTALMQPVAADDCAALLARIAQVDPLNRTVELGGPELMPMDSFVRRFLEARGDPRPVIGDPDAEYFGTGLDDGSLTPGRNPHIGATRLDAWLNRAVGAAA